MQLQTILIAGSQDVAFVFRWATISFHVGPKSHLKTDHTDFTVVRCCVTGVDDKALHEAEEAVCGHAKRGASAFHGFQLRQSEKSKRNLRVPKGRSELAVAIACAQMRVCHVMLVRFSW